MSIFKKAGKKLAQGASEQVRTEVKKTFIDFLPSILGVAVMAVGILIFGGGPSRSDDDQNTKPSLTTTSITTNNYFLGDVSEDIIDKILDD